MANPLSKADKEKQKLVQEKCQTILASMLRDEDNKYCVDCDAKGPRWASWNLGIFLCIRCAGIHRNLGVHISRVKSVNLDAWTPEQVVSLQQMGNSRARAVYEANLPDSFRRPQTDSTLESFIRAKYEAKKYIAKEWVCPPPVKISWDAEIEMEIKRKKEAKRKLNGSPAGPVDLPSSSVSRVRPSDTSSAKEISQPVEVALPAPTKTVSSAAQDLLGLDTVVSNCSAGNDLFGLMTSAPAPINGSGALGGPPKNADEDSFFNQKAPSTTEKRTLDKNSILALYNQSGTTNSAPAAAMPTMPNMFAAQGVYASAQPAAFGPTSTMNTGMMAGGFNPLMQGNMYASPAYPAAGSMPMLSQQMGGLNFGQPPQVAANTAPGMMMNQPAMNPMLANPYLFKSQSTGQQQQQQQTTNLWQ